MTGFSQLGQFLRQSGLGRWGLAVTLLLALLAVGAPWLAPYDPAAQNLPERLVPPSARPRTSPSASCLPAPGTGWGLTSWVATSSRASSMARVFRCWLAPRWSLAAAWSA